MAKPGLVVELRAAVYQAKQQEEIVRHEGIQIKTPNGIKTIDLEVTPFKVGVTNKLYLLVVFQESATAHNETSADLPASSARSKKGKQTATESRTSATATGTSHNAGTFTGNY